VSCEWIPGVVTASAVGAILATLGYAAGVFSACLTYWLRRD